MDLKRYLIAIFVFFQLFNLSIIYAQEQPAQKSTHIIQIESEPQGAMVYYNDEFKGITPCKIELSSDDTGYVYIQKNGYTGFSKKIKPEDTIIIAQLTSEADLPNQFYFQFYVFNTTISYISFPEFTGFNFKSIYYFQRQKFGIGLGLSFANIFEYRFYKKEDREEYVAFGEESDSVKISETDESYIASLFPIQFYVMYGKPGGISNEYGNINLRCELGYLNRRLGTYYNKEQSPKYADFRLGYSFGRDVIFDSSLFELTPFIGIRYLWGGYFYSYGFFDDNNLYAKYDSPKKIKRDNEVIIYAGATISILNNFF